MEREKFQANPFGVINTSMLHDAEIESFLGSDPSEVEGIEKEDEKKEDSKPSSQKTTPSKPETNPKQQEDEGNEVDAEFLGKEGEEEEDNEDKPKGKDKPKPEDEKGLENEEESVNVFSSFSSELKDLGVFSELEEEPEVKDGQSFKQRFDLEIQNRTEAAISNFFSRFGEDYQEALQAIYIDGVNPREYYQYANNIENLSELDMSIVENQKQIIKQYYNSLGWASDKISARIQKLEDSGDLEEDASGYHQVLVQKEQAQLEEIRKKKQQENFQKQQAEQHYQSSISKIINEKLAKKEFDGIPVDQGFANKIADYIITNKYKTANGELLTDFDLEILNLKNPQNYEKKVKLAMVMKLMESDPTFSKLAKKAISKEKDDLFQSLTRQRSTKRKQGEDDYTPWHIN